MRQRNTKRAKKTHAKGFGSQKRGGAIRAMGCLVATAFEHSGMTVTEVVALGWIGCSGGIEQTHAIARQRGATHGDYTKIVPLCHCHAVEAGEGSEHRTPSRRARFNAKYGLELIAKAAEIHAELQAQGIER